ncbi:MAG: flagellar basal body-associated protein flil [Betaproteobacteria bacterium]|nr:flagellar basal body-associated protein flil [Betaproteobacteria bacterium]
MSKAPAPAAAPAESAPPKKSKKMLFIIVAAVLVLGIGGVGTFLIMGKRHGGEKDGKPEAKKVEKKPSVFAALDPFTVNLADRDRDHYLQIGLTYEVAGKDVEEEVKGQMPLIRSRILLLLTSKTATDLATPQGKAKLAGELIALARQPMGESALPSAQGADHGVVNVHFSAFIIQ